MTEGTLVRWLKKEGDRVEKGEPLFEVETEKIVNEAEARDSGILFQIVVPEGAVAPVGAVLGLIAEEGDLDGFYSMEVDYDQSEPEYDELDVNSWSYSNEE